jgi:hypothetical protein
MPLKIRNKEPLSIIVFAFGLALLGFTFLEAYLFLIVNVSISGTDFSGVFGLSIAALTVACIRIIYLGVMGWIGALVTTRAVTLLQQPKSEDRLREGEKPLEKPAAS